jgi:DNA-directed RNA polymerase specialized sigma24 family protein
MTSQNTAALIGIAQDNNNCRCSAISRLWEIYGERIMDFAVFQAYSIMPDYDLKGLNSRQRREMLTGRVYEIFADAVEKYNGSRGASFETYVKNTVVWRFLDEKRGNAYRSEHETRLEYDPDEDGMPEEDVMSMHAYSHQYENDFTDHLFNCDIDVDRGAWEDVMSEAMKNIEDKAELHRLCEQALKVFECCDRYEESEMAKRLGCTTATVYNRYKAIRKILLEQGLGKRVLRLMAA